MCTRLRESLPESEETSQLVSECLGCCESEEVKTYSKAILVTCPFQMQHDAETQNFVEKRASLFGERLAVKMMAGARSSLHLFDQQQQQAEEKGKGKEAKGGTTASVSASDAPAETLNVRGWKSKELTEFLALRLGVRLPEVAP